MPNKPNERTQAFIDEAVRILQANPGITSGEISAKSGMTYIETSIALQHLDRHRRLAKEGGGRGAKIKYTLKEEGSEVSNYVPLPVKKLEHTVGLVKPVTVEIGKSCLKLLVKEIVDRGEPLHGALQQAVMKALLVLTM